MAVMKNIFLGAFAFTAIARAAPMVTITNYVTETTWTTVDETMTVWRPLNEKPTQAAPATSAATTTPVAPPAVLSQTTQAYTAPPPPPAVTTPVTTEVVAAYTPPAAPTTTEAPAPPPAVETTSAAAAPASSSAAPVAQAGSFVQASASNTCEGEGAACEGDVTHWDGGLGACGWNVDTKTDLQIALPVGLMGSLSNSNPYCGRTVTLLNPTSGTTVTAKVGDKCMGCQARAIDCTDALFEKITDGKGDGRMAGIQWWFS